MTSAGRLKRSFFCAIVAEIASTIGVLALGRAANQPNSRDFGSGDLLVDLIGIPLAPGWFLVRGLFERVSLSSLSQILVPAILVLFVSVVTDTAVIFGVWQLFCRVNGKTNNYLSS
jgi:hypothetical protein